MAEDDGIDDLIGGLLDGGREVLAGQAPLLFAAEEDGAALRAANTLPFARRGLLMHLADHEVPTALEDDRGRRFPVQSPALSVAPGDQDGPAQRIWFAPVELGALECRAFTAMPAPVAGAHHEVTTAALDNGRVRAEVDATGRVERLCFDGCFQDLPAPLPLLAGGEVSADILDEGPVLQRLALDDADGRPVVYSLAAGDDGLGIQAGSPRGAPTGPSLRLPVHPGIEGEERGRCFRLPTPTGSLAVIGAEAMDMRAEDGVLHLATAPGPAGWTGKEQMDLLLLDGETHGNGELLRRSLGLSTPPTGGYAPRAPALRWWDLGDLVPLRAIDGDGSLRLLCINAGDRDGVSWLYPLEAWRNCRRVDGAPVDLPRSKEGDGWEVRHRAGEVLFLELEK